MCILCEEIGALTALTALNLSTNMLLALPAALTRVVKLQVSASLLILSCHVH